MPDEKNAAGVAALEYLKQQDLLSVLNKAVNRAVAERAPDGVARVAQLVAASGGGGSASVAKAGSKEEHLELTEHIAELESDKQAMQKRLDDMTHQLQVLQRHQEHAQQDFASHDEEE